MHSRAPVGSTAAAAPEEARALLEATASTSAPAMPQALSGAAAAAHSGLPVLAARVSTASRERLSSVTLQSLVSASNDVLEQVCGAPAQSVTATLHAARNTRCRCLCCASLRRERRRGRADTGFAAAWGPWRSSMQPCRRPARGPQRARVGLARGRRAAAQRAAARGRHGARVRC